MGKLLRAAPHTESSGKNRVSKTGVRRKKETEVGSVFCLDTVGGGKMWRERKRAKKD